MKNIILFLTKLKNLNPKFRIKLNVNENITSKTKIPTINRNSSNTIGPAEPGLIIKKGNEISRIITKSTNATTKGIKKEVMEYITCIIVSLFVFT